MNGYLTTNEIATRWDVSERQVQILCKAGMIDGAKKFGISWAIPENAIKPTATRKIKPGPRKRIDKDGNNE